MDPKKFREEIDKLVKDVQQSDDVMLSRLKDISVKIKCERDMYRAENDRLTHENSRLSVENGKRMICLLILFFSYNILIFF